MSKVSKNIKMLDILSSGKKYTCNELAKLLEISPRMVRLYKDELEKEGIYIDTFYGKNGGYQLKSKIELPAILFNQHDIELMNSLKLKLTNEDDLSKIDELKSKIVTYCNLIGNNYNFLDELKKHILECIKDSISKNKSVKIEYYSKGILKNRIVHPRQIYLYNNSVMIVVQYSENSSDIRHLNLNRIEKIII